MALTERQHLGRQEESIEESGVQLRSSEPLTPAENQVWINTAQNQLKVFADSQKIVLAEGTIGAAVEVAPDGVVDVSLSRSFFKSVTDNSAITAFENLREGLVCYLKITNASTNIAEVTSLVIPAPTSFANGSYFLINSANNANKYYVWANFDGVGVDPAVAGRTGVMISTTAGLKETTTVTCPSAASITSGQHFRLSTADDANLYYVWFNKDLLGGDPLVAGRTGIQVAIVSADTSAQVAAKVQAVLDSTLGLTATVLTNVVTVVNASVGVATDAVNTSVGGLTIAVTQQGLAADTATALAVKVAAALNALADFSSPVPITPTAVITNASVGYTDDAVDGNMGVVPTVTIQGSGRVSISFPLATSVDDNIPQYVNGQTQQLYRIFKTGSNVCVSAAGTFPI